MSGPPWQRKMDKYIIGLTGNIATGKSTVAKLLVAAPRRTLAPSAPAMPVLEMTTRRRVELLGLELDRNVGVVVVRGFVEGLVEPVGEVDPGVVVVPVEAVVWVMAGVVAAGAGGAAGVNVAVPCCSPVWHELVQLVLLEPEPLLLEPEPPRPFDPLPEDDELPLEDVDDALL